MKRDVRFDFIRGIAVLLVVIMHAAVLTPGAAGYPRLVNLLGRGSTGVQLFFVLSGALVYWSWLRAAAYADHPRLVFWAKRFARIYPLYVLFLAANVAVWAAFAFASGQQVPLRKFVSEEDLTAGNLVSHLFFLQGLLPAKLHTLLDGSWSIVNEAYFYLLLPLLAARVKHTRQWLWVYFAALGIAIVSTLLIRVSSFNVDYYSYYNFLAQLPCFLLGVVLARLLDGDAARTFGRNFGLMLAMAAIVLIAAGALDDLRPVGYHHIYAAAFAMMILGLFDRVRALQGSLIYVWLARIGERSYAIFFLHLLLLKVAGYVEIRYDVAVYFPALVAVNFGMALVSCYWLSNVVFHRIDRYFIGVVNRAFQSRVPPRDDMAIAWTPRDGT